MLSALSANYSCSSELDTIFCYSKDKKRSNYLTVLGQSSLDGQGDYHFGVSLHFVDDKFIHGGSGPEK